MGKFVNGAWVEEDLIIGVDDCAQLLKKINAILILNGAIKKAAKEMDKSAQSVLKEVSEPYTKPE